MDANRDIDHGQEDRGPELKRKYPPVASEIAHDIRRMRPTDESLKNFTSGSADVSDHDVDENKVVDDVF